MKVINYYSFRNQLEKNSNFKDYDWGEPGYFIQIETKNIVFELLDGEPRFDTTENLNQLKDYLESLITDAYFFKDEFTIGDHFRCQAYKDVIDYIDHFNGPFKDMYAEDLKFKRIEDLKKEKANDDRRSNKAL